ncbi:Fe(3+)-hydroxamate ABC transporter permease FhuB [Neorhizobium petrolearium]|uniref:Fe(3+)-hydroxamate ABC transporter permease FhuB n=1 Tax=Neorhizobium petrolearium TaxID=515361 RepID=A0ABY8M0C9_9HYPH|nr:Fe(3+)-hydroxamate ABC transporter permease FhuB [Neorhizobium petrolearium]MCC2612911.1 Fe(3+)-hydroxamate ABC transporter permease FhuB [Neorhizobium petrolearium]WGI68020.1 Fe(3+)-hydroxamate ABC transporter permease FhuB [Neorhizobium petrolearium]
MTATAAAHGRLAGPLLVAIIIALAAAAFAVLRLEPELAAIGQQAPGYDIRQVVLLYSTLPRMATALLAGAALGLSGALFQQVLRNPLASPTTLGVSAGANLALALATLYVPDLLGFGRDLVALAGSAIAAGLVFLLGARRGFSPFSLVLSGLVISLWCGALSAVLVMLNDRWLASLFIWGAGSLSQQSWVIPLSLLPKVAIAGLLAWLIVRPLALVELGEAGATALGVDTSRLRLLAIVVAVALAAFMTSAVGVIGFIGLVAPIIVRLSGARRAGSVLLWSALIGAALLWLADGVVQYLAGAFSDFLPTGAVTAVFGSPLLLLLLHRLKVRHRVMPEQGRIFSRRLQASPGLTLAAIAGLALLVAAALLVGRTANGDWALLHPDLYIDILPLRFPRVLGALSAGAMLAIAGTILQRLTGNEMASPEVLGIGAGATIGVTVTIFIVAAPGFGLQITSAAAGALAVLGLVVGFSLRGGLLPERVLLAGIALSAMVDAVVGVLSSTGDPRAMFLLRWMSGSTYGVETSTALAVAAAAVMLVTAAASMHRWLDILPLGPAPAAGLGLSLPRSRLLLFALAGLASAVATLCVGPLSFIGLMGPHLARECGLVRARPQILGAALLGGGLMVVADWLGRTIIFPYQIPAGLVSALVGAPFLMLLMRRK